MKERLLGFLFVGALGVATWDFIADKLHQKFFADSLSVWVTQIPNTYRFLTPGSPSFAAPAARLAGDDK